MHLPTTPEECLLITHHFTHLLGPTAGGCCRHRHGRALAQSCSATQARATSCTLQWAPLPAAEACRAWHAPRKGVAQQEGTTQEGRRWNTNTRTHQCVLPAMPSSMEQVGPHSKDTHAVMPPPPPLQPPSLKPARHRSPGCERRSRLYGSHQWQRCLAIHHTPLRWHEPGAAERFVHPARCVAACAAHCNCGLRGAPHFVLHAWQR